MAFEGEGPQLGFDRLLAELVEQGSSIMATRSRLRELVGVNRELVSNLDLTTVLQRVVEIGAELVGARSVAMVVLGPAGRSEGFSQVGMTSEQLQAMAEQPTGEQLLATMLAEIAGTRGPSPDGVAATPAPRARRFLVVPILLRGEQFGNLYLFESVNDAFSDDDEELALALADTAGIAIENARLYEESLHRRRVSEAIVDLSRLMARDDRIDPVDELLTRMRRLVRTDVVDVVTLNEGQTDFLIDHAQGHGAESLMQTTFPIKGSPLREAMMQTTGATNFDDIFLEQTYGYEELADLGPLISVPFTIGNELGGFLCAVRMVGAPQFTERDTRTVEAFALQMTGIYERIESRDSRRRLSLLEDRERIARDLHDHVIQRLFATGMNLQVAAGRVDEKTADLVEKQIEEIDGAIAQIRQSIFAIRASEKSSGSTLRARVMEIVERMDSGRVHPTVTFLGPVDLMVDGDLTDDVVAVTTEGLANAVRHAQASAISLTIQVGDGRVQVDVIDDGRGMPADATVRGLNNLRARAEARDGGLSIDSDPADGTRLTWVASTF